jgi:hypothetical protein
MSASAPVIVERDDGIWANTPFPDALVVTGGLLRHPRKRGLTWTDDLVDFRLANGRWIYRIERWDHERDEAHCSLVYRDEWDR